MTATKEIDVIIEQANAVLIGAHAIKQGIKGNDITLLAAGLETLNVYTAAVSGRIVIGAGTTAIREMADELGDPASFSARSRAHCSRHTAFQESESMGVGSD